jgi:hypothetical protein
LRPSRPACSHARSTRPAPLTSAMVGAWRVHARRCLHRLPQRVRWAVPLLDPDHPSALACTHEQARGLLLWLHHLPSYEHSIVSCHRHRPPEHSRRPARAVARNSTRKEPWHP